VKLAFGYIEGHTQSVLHELAEITFKMQKQHYQGLWGLTILIWQARRLFLIPCRTPTVGLLICVQAFIEIPMNNQKPEIPSNKALSCRPTYYCRT